MNDTTETPAIAPETKPELPARIQNRMRTPEAIASEMQKTAPEALPFTFRVGAWLWIEFPQKPEKTTLEAVKALGFSWNPRRLAWQNPCGVFRRRNPKIDPRQVYGEEPVTV